jgi:hypothetical protein
VFSSNRAAATVKWPTLSAFPQSVVDITVPALHGTRLLLDDLEKLKDAPKTVKRLADDVHSVDAALKLL